jgi:large subunit ribosomal protein L10e
LEEYQQGLDNVYDLSKWDPKEVGLVVILRENRMIATAGADRLQEGMRRSFGKPSSRAARVKADQAILSIDVNDNALEYAKNALKISAGKLPTTCRIAVEKLPDPPAP